MEWKITSKIAQIMKILNYSQNKIQKVRINRKRQNKDLLNK